MNDQDIVMAARRAEDTGDFSEIFEVSHKCLSSAARQWAPHEAQDQRYKEYHCRPWYKRIFFKQPFGGGMEGRFKAADDLALAKDFRNAVAKRDIKSFTDHRSLIAAALKE